MKPSFTNLLVPSLGLCAVVAFAGCSSSSSPAPTTAPAATVTPVAPEKVAAAPAKPTGQATPPAPAVPAPLPTVKEKDMTHVVTADAPFFTSMPAKGAKPDGTLKSGTKVLVLTPGAPYSKVLAMSGATGYTPTETIDPLGK